MLKKFYLFGNVFPHGLFKKQNTTIYFKVLGKRQIIFVYEKKICFFRPLKLTIGVYFLIHKHHESYYKTGYQTLCRNWKPN